MTNIERRKAQIALAYLSEKRNGDVKGRVVYNGKPTREYLGREDSSSAPVSLESILLTGMIDAHEGRDVMTTDIPNAFIQAPMPVRDEKVIMKITGRLVDILVNMHPETYGEYVVYEKGKKVLYVEILMALYGMLEAALLWYREFRKDLEIEGFKFNVYDGCVANKLVKGKQFMIRFHVDDLMSSHVDPKVNTQFLTFLNKKYGQHGKVESTRGSVHELFSLNLFSRKVKCILKLLLNLNYELR
jgi:hypothetical protein